MLFYKTTDLFDLQQTLAKPLLERFEWPWQALAGIGDFIRSIGPTLPEKEFDQPGEHIWIAKDASVAPSASITGPCIIESGAEVRHCAFIRGNALVGKNAVVGNSTELKNVILFNGVQVPHYNYIGDSILGHKAHMGAGAITSNVKSDKTNVVIKAGGATMATDRKKVGAMLGDFVEVGCNSVLNPGTVLGRNVTVYPTSLVRGVVPQDHIFKAQDAIVRKQQYE